MDSAQELKLRSRQEIDAHRQELTDLSLRIHSNPELSLEEERSAKWLAEYLDGKGFTVTMGAYGLPTAFEAVYGSGGPSIGIIAEYALYPALAMPAGTISLPRRRWGQPSAPSRWWTLWKALSESSARLGRKGRAARFAWPKAGPLPTSTPP